MQDKRYHSHGTRAGEVSLHLRFESYHFFCVSVSFRFYSFSLYLLRYSSSDLMFDENDSFNSSNEYASSIKSMKISKRNHSFELPQYDVPSQDDYFNCVVTMASNPSNFTVRTHFNDLFRYPKWSESVLSKIFFVLQIGAAIQTGIRVPDNDGESAKVLQCKQQNSVGGK